ncbi:MAG: alpha/beta hydrolase [Opitutaceae bacterium]|jgi:acetyl esterase/lipase
MRKLISCLFLFATAALAAPEPIALWPKGAPGAQGDIKPETDFTKPGDGLIAGRPFMRLGNISNPTITIYKPAKERDTGAAVLVCPGGGYKIVVCDMEGTEVCEWLNSMGVTGVLLKYRVPGREGRMKGDFAPLQDAQRAMGLVRQHASEWRIDPNRVGVLGFSAGGHLSALLSNHYETRAYTAIDAADQLSCRPDFAVLAYPAYLVQKDNPTKLSEEMTVGLGTPPTFLVQAEDDGVLVECSLFYYAALKGAKVPAEMHVYAEGGHGYALRPTMKPVNVWPKLAEAWLRGLKILPEAK